jgi:hypothetical protein
MVGSTTFMDAVWSNPESPAVVSTGTIFAISRILARRQVE